MARFQTLSDTQNGSTAFRFIRLAVLPLFYFAKLFSSSLKYVISVRPDFLNTVSQSVPLMAKLAASFELQHIRKPFI